MRSPVNYLLRKLPHIGDTKTIKQAIGKPTAKLYRFLRLDWKWILLRSSIGFIYLWFGVLKFFQDLSPAEELARTTLTALCFGLIPEPVCYLLLAMLETLIGLMLLLNMFVAKTIKLTFVHLLGTFIPMLIQPEIFFKDFPFSITLVGQYILKNIVILCALLILYPHKNNKRTKSGYSTASK